MASEQYPRTTSETANPPAPQRAPFVDRVSDALQGAVKAVIGSNRRPPRRFKSLLHGTWLHHPLHPAITDVPIGAWLLTALFDVLWLAVPSTGLWAPRGAETLALVGVIAALGAAATGLADWSDSYGAERTVGLYHGLLNSLALVLYSVSAVLRFTTPDGRSVVAAVLGFVGLASVLIAAYLGGDMVFAKGTAVNHTAWEAAGEDYEPVLPAASVVENRLYRVAVAGVPVILIRLNDRFSAIAATCSHAGGPLDEGTVESGVVQCPWHGSRFRLSDGHVLTGPATVHQPRYDVRIRDGQVELRRLGGH